MIGLFLLTHATYGESLLQCACHILDQRPEQIVQLGISGSDDPADVLPLAQKMLRLVDSGEGALILTDIFGATPANIALKLLDEGRIEGVAGVNLPMLLRALNYRDQGMTILLQRTLNGGRDGILSLRDH